ncbi:hypothetical protein V5O48_019489, partial [Marasmius crinis-equi]
SDEKDEKHAPNDYVSADVRLDKLCKDLPFGRKEELNELLEQFKASREVRDAQEPRDLEAEELEKAREPELPEYAVPPTVNPTILDSCAKGPNLRSQFEVDSDFMKDLHRYYKTDPLFSKILEKPTDHPKFIVDENSGSIWTTNLASERVL